MRKFGIILLAASGLAGSALAQNLPAPAAAPAPVPAPSAAQLAIARDAIKAIGADRQLESMTNQLKQMATMQSQTLAPATATDAQKAAVAKMQAAIQELATEANRNMSATLEKGFAEVFTEAELVAIKAFFSSPEGQSFKAKQPQLSMRIGPQMQQLNEELRQKVGVIMQTAQQEAAPAPVSVTTPPVTATTPPVEVPPSAPAK